MRWRVTGGENLRFALQCGGKSLGRISHMPAGLPFGYTRRREVFSLRFFNFLLTKIVVSGMLYMTIIVVKLTGVLVRRGARPCRWKTD